LSAYHWMEITDGQIFAAGDFFDATGMMMAVAAE
jgi:F0F1-type ATP synthase alpha subunit